MPENGGGDNLKDNYNDNGLRRTEDEIRRHGELVKVMSQLVKSLEISHGKETDSIYTLRELVRAIKENNVATRRSSEVTKSSSGGGSGFAGALRSIIGGPVGGLAYLFMGKMSLEKIIDVADGVIKLVDEQIMTARKMRATLAMPGSGMGRVSTIDMWEMARGIDAAMKKFSNGVMALEDFQRIMMQLKESGLSVLAPITRGGGTMVDIVRSVANASLARGQVSNPQSSVNLRNKYIDTYIVKEFEDYIKREGKNPLSNRPELVNASAQEKRQAMKSVIGEEAFERAVKRGTLEAGKYPGADIEEFNSQIAKGNGELVAFSIYLGKLGIATGVSTDALIKNGGALYRQEIGFEKHGRTITSTTEAIGQAAELAMLSQDKLAGINRPADEFISDMTNATNVIRFFSTDIGKSKRELIKLNIAESTAINNLIFSLTDVVNMMDSAFKPDLTQAALTLDMIGRYPEKFPSLTAAFSNASPEGKLMATDRLSTFSAPEYEEWKKQGSDMRLVPSFFKDISEDLGITLEKALELAPEIGKARLETPELLLNSMGLKGGARAFAGFELLPTLFPWLSKLDTSQGRQTTDALLQFGAGVNLTKEQLSNFSSAIGNVTKSLQGAVNLDATINDRVNTLAAGVYNAFIESFGGKQVTVQNITASGETLKFEGTLNLTVDGETKTYTPTVTPK
jgi:hypothetical protein